MEEDDQGCNYINNIIGRKKMMPDGRTQVVVSEMLRGNKKLTFPKPWDYANYRTELDSLMVYYCVLFRRASQTFALRSTEDGSDIAEAHSRLMQYFDVHANEIQQFSEIVGVIYDALRTRLSSKLTVISVDDTTRFLTFLRDAVLAPNREWRSTSLEFTTTWDMFFISRKWPWPPNDLQRTDVVCAYLLCLHMLGISYRGALFTLVTTLPDMKYFPDTFLLRPLILLPDLFSFVPTCLGRRNSTFSPLKLQETIPGSIVVDHRKMWLEAAKKVSTTEDPKEAIRNFIVGPPYKPSIVGMSVRWNITDLSGMYAAIDDYVNSFHLHEMMVYPENAVIQSIIPDKASDATERDELLVAMRRFVYNPLYSDGPLVIYTQTLRPSIVKCVIDRALSVATDSLTMGNEIVRRVTSSGLHNSLTAYYTYMVQISALYAFVANLDDKLSWTYGIDDETSHMRERFRSQFLRPRTDMIGDVYDTFDLQEFARGATCVADYVVASYGIPNAKALGYSLLSSRSRTIGYWEAFLSRYIGYDDNPAANVMDVFRDNEQFPLTLQHVEHSKYTRFSSWIRREELDPMVQGDFPNITCMHVSAITHAFALTVFLWFSAKMKKDDAYQSDRDLIHRYLTNELFRRQSVSSDIVDNVIKNVVLFPLL